MEQNLENKLLKGKIELMTKSAFISSICLSVRHFITTDVKTAATNGARIFYNPEFISKLSVAEMAGLIAHECWHIVLMHLIRRGDRLPIPWNIAGDLLINPTLVANGFEIPAGGLLDPKYDMSWATDEIYNDIMKNNPDMPHEGMMMDIQGEFEGTEKEQKALEAEIKDIIIKAHTQADISGQGRGFIPGEIVRIIEELLNPKLPWPVLLNRFLNKKVKEDYSWARRNRRYANIYMPSLFSMGLSHLTFAVDTSGSQDDDDLRGTLSEIRGVQRVFNPEIMTIIDCDARIHNVYDITADVDILSLKFTGRGGTKFQPVLDYVAENPTDALIYFTDLDGETNLSKVDYPILWICNSNHAPATIGETIYM